MYVKNLTSGDDVYAGDEGAPDNADLVNGGAGNDQISGGLDADILHGDDGDDLLNGGVGDDTLDGGNGDDTAVFSGAAGDYVWSGDRTSATITGPDGTDTLVNVEHLRFGATVIDLPAPNTAPGAPTDGDSAANTVAEGAANGTAVAGLSLGAVDPDAGQTLTWSLLDDAGGRFAINAATGVVTVADAAKLNFETATAHQITVQVSDGTATSSTSFTIDVANVAPTAPADSNAAANTVAEDAGNGAVVAGLAIGATDPNGGAITYSLLDDAGGRFAIDATTGVVTVADANLLDFDAAASHQITVRASDGTTSAATDTTFTIDVTNVAPTAPVDADTAANTVSEGAANGALVGVTASATEAKTGAVTYSLSDDAGGRFAIDAATGVVTVADATKLNFESATSHQITVRAADAQGAASTQAFTIAVTNVAPAAPTDGDTAANTVSEGAANGAVVAGLAISAADVNGGPLTYSLLDNAGGRFAINAATGVVTVANASLLNFETATSHQITVQVSDGTATSSASFTIDVTNVATPAPADSNAAANTVAENAANGTVVAGLAIGAADPNGGATYSLVDDAGGRFAINAATGVVTVANASLLDYDTATTHQITVRAGDGTTSADTSFAIDVTNAPPSTPTDADAAVNTVSEGAANGALVGVTASAADTGFGSVSYSLSNDAGGRFAIDATTGVVTIADATKLNFETAASHQITVRATDGQGAFSSQTFTIAVTNVANDAPQDTNPAANTISEAAVNGDLVTGLAIVAPDINGGPLIYTLLDDAGGRFTINAATGVVSVADATKLNFEAAASHQIVVQAASGSELASSSFTINVTNAAPVLVDTNAAANLVSEFAKNGAVVGGLTVGASDPHGGTVTYSLTNNAGGRFALNTTTGVVTVANASLLDHDTQSMHTITVQATDGLLTTTTDFVITLIDQIDSTWVGTTAANTFTVPDVQDWQLDGIDGNDTLTGGVGDDILIGGAGDDILAGGGGNDSFMVGVDQGVDSYDGGAGYDTIKVTTHNTWIGIKSITGIEALSLNGWSNVNIGGSTGADTLDFTNVLIPWSPIINSGAGADTVTGTTGDDYIQGDAGADTLNGGLGNDKLDGGTENDILNGGDGNDILIGGGGNDAMAGGAGDDTFQVWNASGVDAIDGGAGTDTLKAMEANTVFSFTSITGIEVISNGGFGNVSIAGTTGNEDWNFSGATISAGIVISAGAGNDGVTGTAGADIIKGDAGGDSLNGGAGNDNLDGGADADSINGGDGDDTIIGGAGNDVLNGGNGDDTFLIGVGAGIDEFDGAAGYDTIRATADNTVITPSWLRGIEAFSSGGFANVTITASSGNDDMDYSGVVMTGIASISGGAGDDWIKGTAGADTLKGDAGNDWLYGGGGNDILEGGAGNDLVNGGAGDDIFLVGVGAGIDAFEGDAGYDTIQASANNVAISFSAIPGVEAFSNGGFTGVTITGTTAADDMNFSGVVTTGGITITAGSGNDVVTGSNGVDIIKGDAGADTIYGNGGNDNIDGGADNDGIDGGDGDDTLFGAAGLDSINGAAGNDTIDGGADSDTLDGGLGDDQIIGGAGNDILIGGGGDDTFLIGLSAGSDSFDGGAGYDTIKASAANVVLSFTSITGVEAFSNGGFTGVTIAGSSGDDDMNFTGVLTTGGMTISGGAGNDTITGTNGVDILKGDAGNDTIHGLDGNDVIDGGTGVDNLYGGGGDDTFLVGVDATFGADNFDGGAGVDTIQATANNVAMYVGATTGVEIISSGGFTGVTVAGTGAADDMNFTGKTFVGTVVINGLGGNDTITGGGGADNIRGGDGNDTLYGAAGADTIGGDAGTDALDGGDGNDILDGGADNDTLYGGAGDDVLLIGYAAGTDSFDGGAGFDEIRGSMNNATVWFSNLTSIEKISGGGFSNVTISLQNLLSYANWDFTNIELSGIASIVGGNQSETIIGSNGNDVIFGGYGTDILKGGLGDDTFTYNGTFSGLPWADTVDGGAGWDRLLAQSANTMILASSLTSIEEISTGGFSGVSLAAFSAADTIDLRNIVVTGTLSLIDLSGGDDTFYGTAGSNTVDGGTGNDFIDTGDGDDIIQLSFNNGWDDIRGGAGYDKIIAPGGGPVWVPFNFQGIEEVVGSTSGNTQIHGTSADDLIDLRGVKLTQVQYTTGELGNDTIHGSYGADYIMGDRGFDTIYGEAGDDRIWFTAYGDTDVVDGGDGYDTLAAWSQGVIIAVSSMTNIEAIDGAGNANVGIAFTDGDDNFDLTNIAVTGVAYIDLKAGADIFVGSASADRIIGGLGADTMTGGAGADVFDYNDAAEGAWDVITDFVSGVDRIDLSTIDASPTNSQGNHAFVFIGSGAFTHATGQVRYEVTSGGVVFSGDVNGDGVAEFNVTLTGVSSLSAADFVL